MRSSATGHVVGRAWTAALRQVARRRSVILCYHGVADAPPEQDPHRLQLPPEIFRTQLEMLRVGGFRFVTVAEFAGLAADGPPPPGFAVVSFDDGLRNNLSTALPILKQLGIRATIYVPTGWLGGRHPDISGESDAAILTREEVRELAREGWEIGGHTVNHADLSHLDHAECRAEIEPGCEELARLTGTAVQTFAYPFGRCGPAAISAAQDCGLLAAVAGESKTWRPFELSRIMVGGADSLPVFLLKLIDRHDRYERLLDRPAVRAVRNFRKAALRSIAGQRSAKQAETIP